MICEWSSSPFPQNSFSLISYIIPSYSLFHPPLTPISRPSPSSPLISAIHSYYHPCSLCIHFHPMLPLSHFHHTHSYPFPFQSSHSISFHHSHSFTISLLTHRSLTFCVTLYFHYPPLSFFSSNLILISLFHSFLFFATRLLFSTM